MTFEDWMRSERVTYKPSDDSVEDRALRRCWDAAVAAERERSNKLRAELRRVQDYIDETPELFEALGPLDHGA